MGLDIHFYKVPVELRGVVENYSEIENVDSCGYLRKVNIVYSYCDKYGYGVYFDKDGYDLAVLGYDELQGMREMAQDLLEKQKVLTETEFEVLAEETLPVMKGFFFGDYDYKEGYTDQLEALIEEVGNILEAGTSLDEYMIEFNY